LPLQKQATIHAGRKFLMKKKKCIRITLMETFRLLRPAAGNTLPAGPIVASGYSTNGASGPLLAAADAQLSALRKPGR